jgi:hypothetical protein
MLVPISVLELSFFCSCIPVTKQEKTTMAMAMFERYTQKACSCYLKKKPT